MYVIDSLMDTFNQAGKDADSAPLTGIEYIGYIGSGVKITKDINTNEVHIYNTHLGGDYYREISKSDYLFFLENGWKLGVIHIALYNCNAKLLVNQRRIDAEYCSGSCNEKLLHELLSYRESLKLKYNQIIKKQSNLIKWTTT